MFYDAVSVRLVKGERAGESGEFCMAFGAYDVLMFGSEGVGDRLRYPTETLWQR